LRVLLRPVLLRSRLELLAERVLALLFRPLRLLPVPFRLLPLLLLADPLRFRLLPLAALRSLRLLPVRSVRPLFRSLRLLPVPRVLREPVPDRSLAAVRVEEERESSDAAACSWSIRCPASLVQLCDGTPRALSCRAKLLAAVSFGKGPTRSRLGPE
jgi:hypothetical protein